MNAQEASDVGRGDRGRKALKILFACCFTLLSSLAASLMISFLLGFLLVGIGRFSDAHPVSVPARCRILSSSVDIRSSKVCELGLLNYKAKHVFYALEKRRFRCRDDYYWASVFEVEYRESFSGQIRYAVAEAPKEALPLDCRPNFGAAWLSKMKYKVNETYSCKYTLGSRKADLETDNVFNCQAEDPSAVEMIRRILIMFMSSSFSFDKETAGRKMAYTVAGIVSGMLTPMCFIIVIKILRSAVLSMAKHLDLRKLQVSVFAVRFRRACLLVAYFSAVTWIMLQYGKIIGLRQFFFDYSFRERAMTS